ncbi:hypothetical protein CKM354_000772500 [Cercospora kikuchii]|uniref:Insecticide toxin TcdB middle/N-terminal domain-containing protein n=1 Tax=Cercospora kikuchii TaxID=84275 RepID=A0A9P3CHK3_9PEZI|nr:uncharacterized protein CKM354_000772500 [Cercospora kikuchii]GIZ44529.1 hypothetical protein CKM354_000772500 [Cercospora kikuchii]
MATDQPAIGREVGKVDTDSGGLARYSLKILLPPGITHDVEPELSLEYCQGGPNGSLGAGWALGGLSCIRRGPSTLAYDSFNPPPSDHDVTKPKLNLDGAELLLVSGTYDGSDAEYTTEVENVRRSVVPRGLGFLVRESTGKRLEYGTTEDSKVFVSGTQTIREWRLKRVVDYHGNFMTYNYTSSPRGDNAKQPDANACYLSSVEYSANEKTGLRAARAVKMGYSDRPDVMIQTVQGDRCTWASLLTSVQIGLLQEGTFKAHLTYELAYSASPDTGDSCLTSITESSTAEGKKVSLLPSTFGYTAALPAGTNRQDLFKPASPSTVSLPATTNNVALFALNISGRCMADLACVRYNPATRQVSVKTYLAERQTGGTVSWKASTGPGAEATLQSVDMKNGFPSILSPDMNNDGRSDIVVPYSDSDSRVCFSVSQCVGTGFQNARPKKTNFPWTEGSKFMAMDLTGRGTVDIVQIFTDKQKLAFRNFPALNRDGQIGLQDAILSPTKYDNVNNIDWFQLRHAATDTKSLVRIWAQDLGMGQVQLKATAFNLVKALDSTGGFREGTTSLLGNPIRAGIDKVKPTVLPCDINADGVQDVILASAEWKAGRMVLVFDTYLGDGAGAFKKHGETITRTIVAEQPLSSDRPGEFYVTNVNGSNYPSLSYVYQERTSKSYLSLTVEGRSDGFVTEATLITIAKDLPGKNMQVVSSDINGNGTGDWLFHTIENDVPRVVPVYNRTNAIGLLSWAQDPMGLRTNLTYGSLSDPAVYNPRVDWTKYENSYNDGYTVIAAPSAVVTQLEHRNDTSVNSFNYGVVIKKSYEKARVNVAGRGWQGFEQIHTTNVNDGVLTTEKYHQAWPLTGTKSQIDTKQASDGVILRSVKTSFEVRSRAAGPWKVYRINRLIEQMDMIDSGSTVRSNATQYAYDDLGNMVLRSLWETQRNRLMFQSWKRCSYMTIDGVTNVLVAEKLSSKESNTDMSKFEEGDCSLVKYENETARAILKAVSEWSTDIGAFSTKQITFDEYGKEVSSVDASGLRRITTYDDLFHTFPIKILEEGNGVQNVELTAFDGASGIEVARQDRDGMLTCYRLDSFGRVRESRAKATSQGSSQVAAQRFLSFQSAAMDASLKAILSGCNLDPHRSIDFERVQSPSDSAHIAVKVTTFSHDGSTGQHQVVDYVDCIKQKVFESLPTRLQMSTGLDWLPATAAGIRSVMDVLGRPVSRVRPAHQEEDRSIVTTSTYLDGGARVQERTLSSKDSNSFTDAEQLALLERRYIHWENEDLIIENVDENGLRSTFQHDAFGRLVQCTDPAGRIETRAYNPRGDIISLDNEYQNTMREKKTPAYVYRYDATHKLVSQSNIAGDSITYRRDGKGRLLEKVGNDGQVVRYTYDSSGSDKVSSITVSGRGAKEAFDFRWEYSYDHRGRVRDRKLILNDGSNYTTSLSYDWQDRVIEKILPDEAVLKHQYHGSIINASSLLSNKDSSWGLKAETTAFNPMGRPERLVLSGNSLPNSFIHEWKHDSQGFPIRHALKSNDQALVDEHYSYNDLDQMSRKQERISGSVTDYKYQGKRLAASQIDGKDVNSYSYDAAGNLSSRRGTAVQYGSGFAKGTKDGRTIFDLQYDGVGRTARRVTEKSAFELTYDSFGALRNMKDPARKINIDFLADQDGETLQRKHSNGSTDLFFDDDFSIHVSPEGSSTIRHKFRGTDDHRGAVPLLASLVQACDSLAPIRVSKVSPTVSVAFADTKGNITHSFDGNNGSLKDKFNYDDFGLLAPPDNSSDEQRDKSACYEGNYTDEETDLVNFGGRWYDPLVGRFTTPDNILDIPSLIRTDGLNRYAFENNDPINNIDPTGHWSWSAILGVVVSVVLVVAAVAVTVVTGGAAAPLAAAAVGALASGGIAGIFYSVKHKDENDAGKFWKGFGTTVAINAAIGAATGAAGAFAGPARVASTGARMLIKGAIGGTASVLTKAAERGTENLFYGTHHNLFEGAAKSFLTGFAVGAIFGASSGKPTNNSPNKLVGINKFEGNFKLRDFTGIRKILEPKPTNPWMGLTKEILKVGGKAAAKPVAKVGFWAAKEMG